MKYVFRMNSLAKRTIGDRKILFARDDSGSLLLLVNDNLGREPVTNSLQPRIIIDDDIVSEFGLQDDCRFQLVPTNGEATLRYIPQTVEEVVDVYEERHVPIFEDKIGILPMMSSLTQKKMFKFKYNPAIPGRPASFGMSFVGMQNRIAALTNKSPQNTEMTRVQVGTKVERVKVGTEKKVLNSKLLVEHIHARHDNDEFRLVNIGLATVGTKVSGNHPIITVAVMSEAA